MVFQRMHVQLEGEEAVRGQRFVEYRGFFGELWKRVSTRGGKLWRRISKRGGKL